MAYFDAILIILVMSNRYLFEGMNQTLKLLDVNELLLAVNEYKIRGEIVTIVTG